MNKPNQGRLSSFINYLKWIIQTIKKDFKSLFKKEIIEEKEPKKWIKEEEWPEWVRRQELKRQELKRQELKRQEELKIRSKRGKESKLDLHRGEIVASLDNGETKASIARKYDVSAVNLHYWIQRRKIKVSKKR